MAKAVKKVTQAKKKSKPVAKTVKSEIKKKSDAIKTEPQYYFIVQDGTQLADLKELALMLDVMDDHIYNHHVNYEKNDFANWAENTFEEKELANELRQVMNRFETQRVVLKYLVKKHL